MSPITLSGALLERFSTPTGRTNAKVVKELLRHASMKVTTAVYVQAVSPQKREAQSKLVRMVLKKAASLG